MRSALDVREPWWKSAHNNNEPPRIADTRRDASNESTIEGIVGRSSALRAAIEQLDRVAPLDTTVLLRGETGTGKELFAKAVHRRSRRASHRLVAVNLAAMPKELVAAELFGHEAGAFTGAVQRRIGTFETAHRGTLFLDEVGELSGDIQVSLLRAIEEREVTRLGASQPQLVDVRLITATNRHLEGAVEEGRFRSDLYYRLNVFPIELPPLRERRDDIKVLADYFLDCVQDQVHRRFRGISRSSLDRLLSHDWPGNIRELKNVIERSAILSDGGQLEVRFLPYSGPMRDKPMASGLAATVEHSERVLIEKALEECDGRVSGRLGAAQRLGVYSSTLEAKIKRLGIDKLRYRISSNAQSA